MAFDASKVSPLGFGCMRFEGHETDTIDIEQVSEFIDAYLEAGGNYFDTAWAYPSSEAALGKALVARHPRESYFIASKCVAWTHCESQDDLRRQLDESLAALGTDYLDVYLMHNLGGKRTAAFEAMKAWEFVKEAKERGLVRHIGFSAHCTPEELEELIAAHPEAELVQLQVNYSDWENPAWRERECVEVAARHGLPVVAMEPVKGGILANPPASVRAVLDETLPEQSYAATALRFAANVPGVCCALSGMSTLDMVRENCAALIPLRPLSDVERDAISAAQRAMEESGMVQCTGCDYCAKVCPQGIGISGSLASLNTLANYDDPYAACHQLGFVVFFNQGKAMPDACVGCGACEQVCPQGLPIVELLERVKNEVMPFQPELEVTMKP